MKKEFQQLVPKNYIVEIEFEPESKILTISEEITLKIYKKNVVNVNNNELQRYDGLEINSENWNLKPNSEELKNIIKTIGWSNDTIAKIKKLLSEANCISIKNGEITTVGFARSGMGKYSYLIFNQPLNDKEKLEYNNGL